MPKHVAFVSLLHSWPSTRRVVQIRHPHRCATSIDDRDNRPASIPLRAVSKSRSASSSVTTGKLVDDSPKNIDSLPPKVISEPVKQSVDPLQPLEEPNPLTLATGFAAVLVAIGFIVWATQAGKTDGGAVVRAVEEFIEGPRFLVSLGMGVSAFIQALTGFGFAIVSVGALTQLDWVVHSSVFEVVQPVAATLGAATGWALLLPEIRLVDWRSLGPLLISSTIATPFGVAALGLVDGHFVLRSLGALIAGYVGYSVAGVDVPKRLGGTGGSWILGVIAGAFGGAFDITGPPLVVHGEAASWNQADGTFRRNVLAVVSVNSTIVVLFDAFLGRLNDFYYWDFVKYAAPAVVVGIIAGNWLSKRLEPSGFKKIVLATCAMLGAKLLVS